MVIGPRHSWKGVQNLFAHKHIVVCMPARGCNNLGVRRRSFFKVIAIHFYSASTTVCETKVTDAANEPAVEQHVGRLDVAMDNLDVCVQVHQATRDVGQDDDALVGRESASTCLGLGESERQTQAKGEGKAQNAS